MINSVDEGDGYVHLKQNRNITDNLVLLVYAVLKWKSSISPS